MANKKISSLNSLGGTPDSADIIPITDVSDTTGSVNGTTKKVTVANLVAAAPPVDGTQVTSTGETGATKFLREDGDGTCSFQEVSITDENLRGTDNPHIGAFPNQSFLVTDNPFKSAMVVADEAGNLKLLNSLGVNNIAVGFSVVEDSTEPDIEAVGTLSGATENYSVISGDSDTKGANGLSIRQGFNFPDIGANPAPILISGGSIT